MFETGRKKLLLRTSIRLQSCRKFKQAKSFETFYSVTYYELSHKNIETHRSLDQACKSSLLFRGWRGKSWPEIAIGILFEGSSFSRLCAQIEQRRVAIIYKRTTDARLTSFREQANHSHFISEYLTANCVLYFIQIIGCTKLSLS